MLGGGGVEGGDHMARNCRDHEKINEGTNNAEAC